MRGGVTNSLNLSIMGVIPYYVERKWGVTDQIRGCQLQQKRSSVLYADLALMLRHGAHRLASVLERGAHMLALKLKHEATQGRVLMLKRDPEVCVSKNNMTIAFDRDCEVRV